MLADLTFLHGVIFLAASDCVSKKWNTGWPVAVIMFMSCLKFALLEAYGCELWEDN
jgi:hypothetical protein